MKKNRKWKKRIQIQCYIDEKSYIFNDKYKQVSILNFHKKNKEKKN